MRNRIQKSMIFVVMMSLLISYILVTLVIYRQALDIRRSELVQEAEYIRAAIDISGEEYFGTMDKVSKNTRVTWIEKRIQRGIGKWQWTGYPYVRQQRTGDVLLCAEDG